MASQFVLRTENDTANPFATRLYGLGITQGRTVFYLPSAVGDRTAFLVILAEGARAPGDLACSKPLRVYYAGFELAEFDTGAARQWKFHKGTVSKNPVWRAIQSVDTATDIWRIDGHGWTNLDPISFHARGTDVIFPAATLYPHVQYTAYVVDADHIKLLPLGSTDPATAFDLTSVGVHLDRLFAFKADAWLFDPDQGRPYFFSGTDFTFSGLCYIEVLLPSYLSDGANEPQNLKVVMEGKEMYDVLVDGRNFTFDTGTITAQPNNALVLADTVINDLKRPLSRINGPSLIAFRDRCEEAIEWAGGAGNPAEPASFETIHNLAYDSSLNGGTLTNSGGAGGVAWDSYAVTHLFTNPESPSAEAIYEGGTNRMSIAFVNNNSGAEDGTGGTSRQGAHIHGGWLGVIDPGGGGHDDIMPIAAGDRVKVAYENGLLVIYLNGVPLPPANDTYEREFTDVYIEYRITDPNGKFDNILIAPSDTPTGSRMIPRFRAHMAASQPIAVSDAIEACLHMAPGCSWADIDGQMRFATEPDRTPCFTFVHDPTGASGPSNVAKVTVKKKSDDQAYNFYSFIYRNADDPILKKDFIPVDRKERRAAEGGLLKSAGVITYGVLSQSQMERLSEARVRAESDLDIGFTVEAFLDSIVVAKGSYGYLIDPVAGYPAGSPALCMVLNEGLNISTVETRTYELQIITADWYSDTDHGQVFPVTNALPTAAYTPPGVAAALTVTESIEPMPDNSVVSSISGLLTFAASVSGQYALIFLKALTQKFCDGVGLDPATNILTAILSAAPDTAQAYVLYYTTAPGGAPAIGTPVYIVGGLDYDPTTHLTGLQFSLTAGGSPIDFTSAGAGWQIWLWEDTPWKDAGLKLAADADNQASFEIFPARKALTFIAAQVFSSGGVSLPFGSSRTAAILVEGDTTPPAPPTSGSVVFVNPNLTWSWTASPTLGISGYVLTDETGAFVAQVSTVNLSYVETARTDHATRRIFAANSTGILSSSYAEVVWTL